MRATQAVAAGLSHAVRSKRLIVCLWLFSLLAALPATLVVRESVKRSVGASRMHLDLQSRFDMDWYNEYQHEAVGIEEQLTPTSVRPAAFLDNLDAWFSGNIFTSHPALVAMGVTYALTWTLILGGVLRRFHFSERDFSLRSLLGHGGEMFPRFARLLLMTTLGYYGVYRLGRWLFGTLEDAMRDVTVEKTALAVYLAAATMIAALLLLVKLSGDYAKVATVVDGRRSMVLALWTGLRFTLAHPARAFGAYFLIFLGGMVLLGLYALVAPGQGQASLATVLWALLLGQLVVAARMVQKLTTYGAALEIYRGRGD
jgi:hypothetical protein